DQLSRPLARVLGVSWMRDQRVARIAVSPARWDPTSGTLTVEHRIELDVRFDAAAANPAGKPDAFEPLYRELLANYEQGRDWRGQPARLGALSSPPALGGRLARPAAIVPDNSLYAGRSWVKIAIPATGFYRVEFSQLIGTRLFTGADKKPIRTTPLSDIRLFTWPGTPVLPEDSYCDSCGYQELATQFVETAPA